MADQKDSTKSSDAGTKAADKHARTTAGRTNGGNDDNPGLITGRPGLDRIGAQSAARQAATLRPDNEGDRETVSPADLDRVFTADSKERWGDDQPSLSDQLAAARTNEMRIAKKQAGE